MLCSPGEARTSSKTTIFYGLLCVDAPLLADQYGLTSALY